MSNPIQTIAENLPHQQDGETQMEQELTLSPQQLSDFAHPEILFSIVRLLCMNVSRTQPSRIKTLIRSRPIARGQVKQSC